MHEKGSLCVQKLKSKIPLCLYLALPRIFNVFSEIIRYKLGKNVLPCIQKRTSLSQIFVYWKIFKTGLFEVWRGRKSYFILLFHHHFCSVDKWWSFFAASHELLLLPRRVYKTQKKEKIIFLPVILLSLSIDLVLSKDFYYSNMVMSYTWSGIEFLGAFLFFLSDSKSEHPIRLNFHILAACCVAFVCFKAAICA